MKAHLAKVSLALLSVAFLLGCQEQGSDPVGPEGLGPEFHHGKGSHADGGGGASSGDNPGASIYEYTFTGDITTDPSPAGARNTAGNNNDGTLVLHGCCGGGDGDGPLDSETLILSSDFLANFGTSSEVAACFGGIFPLENFLGTLRPEKKNMNNVEAIFHFKAWDGDKNEADYILRLDGIVNPTGEEIFPPEDEKSTLVTFSLARMTVGQGTNRVNSLCIGDVKTNFSVLVTGRLTDLDLNL